MQRRTYRAGWRRTARARGSPWRAAPGRPWTRARFRPAPACPSARPHRAATPPPRPTLPPRCPRLTPTEQPHINLYSISCHFNTTTITYYDGCSAQTINKTSQLYKLPRYSLILVLLSSFQINSSQKNVLLINYLWYRPTLFILPGYFRT